MTMAACFTSSLAPFNTDAGATKHWLSFSANFGALGSGRYGDAFSRSAESGSGYFAVTSAEYAQVSLAVKVKNLSNPGTNIRFEDRTSGVLTHCTVAFNTAGELNFYRGNSATLLATTSGAGIHEGEWNHIEILVRIADSPNGACHIFVNGGADVANFTGLDTKNDATSTVVNVVLVQFSQSAITDVWAKTGTPAAGLAAEQVGDTFIYVDYPDTEGNYSAWTPSTGTDNANLIDESPLDDSDYNSTDTAPNKDTFNFPNVDSTIVDTNTIQCANTMVCAMFVGSGPHTMRIITRDVGTTTDYFSAAFSTSSSTQYYSHIQETDPQDPTNPWTIAKLDDTEPGYEYTS